MYQIGYIYKIECNEVKNNDVYIGSTFDCYNRWSNHKMQYEYYLKGQQRRNASSIILFDKYSIEKCEFSIIKEYQVVDRLHLEVFETLWIKKYRILNYNVVNQIQPFFIKTLFHKVYYLSHQEEIKERVRLYASENKDKIKERGKIYRQRPDVKARKKKKYICNVCNTELLLDHKARHERSRKHLQNLLI